MALNPATANVSPGASGAIPPEGQSRPQQVGPAFAPQFRQGPANDLRTPGQFGALDPDARANRNVTGFRRNVDDRLTASADPQAFSGGLYGDYWDGAVAVFPLSSFEAQLFVQESPQSNQPTTPHSEGNQSYLDIKAVLEQAMAAPTDADDVLEEEEESQHVNVLA